MTKSMYARLLEERENKERQGRNNNAIFEHKSQRIVQDDKLMRESEGFRNRNGLSSVKHKNEWDDKVKLPSIRSKNPYE